MFYQGKNNTIYPGDNVSDDTFLGLVLVLQYMVSVLSSTLLGLWIKTKCNSGRFLIAVLLDSKNQLLNMRRAYLDGASQPGGHGFILATLCYQGN